MGGYPVDFFHALGPIRAMSYGRPPAATPGVDASLLIIVLLMSGSWKFYQGKYLIFRGDGAYILRYFKRLEKDGIKSHLLVRL
jgi:hypothetical protein